MKQMRSQSFFARCGWLAVITLAACLLALIPAWKLYGQDGLMAEVFAAVVCFVPGCIVFRLIEGVSGSQAQIRSVLIGTGLRVVFALAGAAVMDAGLGFAPRNYLLWLGLFYLVTLAVETYLVMPAPRAPRQSDSLAGGGAC